MDSASVDGHQRQGARRGEGRARVKRGNRPPGQSRRRRARDQSKRINSPSSEERGGRGWNLALDPRIHLRKRQERGKEVIAVESHMRREQDKGRMESPILERRFPYLIVRRRKGKKGGGKEKRTEFTARNKRRRRGGRSRASPSRCKE